MTSEQVSALQDCPECGRRCANYSVLSRHLTTCCPDNRAAIAEAVLRNDNLREAQRQTQRPRLEAAARRTARKPGEPTLPPPPPLPAPYMADISIDTLLGNERTFNFYAREELRVVPLPNARPLLKAQTTVPVARRGTSAADAPAVIATEQRDTIGASQPLLLDPRKGLDEPRRKLDAATSKLGLKFYHLVASTVGGGR